MGASFGSTVQLGIQDLSALLPLLGTKQCEDQIGSALIDGYLYAVATPLSIFGSLGIVLSGLKFLVASFTFKLGSWSVFGAKHLADAGFQPSGKAASMIQFDVGKSRYLAEARLKAMLEDQHIENTDMLTAKRVCWRWNLTLFLLSIIPAVLNIVPYIHLILRDQSKFSVLARWAYPIARAVGSLITSTMIQIVVQNRVLQIVKMRIIFMTLDQFKKSHDILQLSHEEWNPDQSSEQCIWNLESEKVKKEDSNCSLQGLHEKLIAEKKRHSLNKGTRHIELVVSQILLLLGLASSVTGYVGSFSLVQSSQDATGPLIWLGLEILLSISRIFIWGWNPRNDESTGIEFTLKLVSHCPMVTCNKFDEEISEEGIFPLVRADDFLSSIASYSGLLERIEDEKLSLYYTLTRNEKTKERILYVTTLDYRERSSRLFRVRLEDSKSEQQLFYSASLKVDESDETVECDRVGSTPLVADSDQDKKNNAILDHCRFILEKLRRRGVPGSSDTAKMATTWSLQVRPRNYQLNSGVERRTAEAGIEIGEISKESDVEAGGTLEHSRFKEPRHWWSMRKWKNSSLNRRGDLDSSNSDNPSQESKEDEVTAEDIHYLEVGQLERLRKGWGEKRGQWISEYMKVVRTEIVNDEAIIGRRNKMMELIEAEINQSLLIAERRELERVLVEETAELEFFLQEKHEALVRSLARLKFKEQLDDGAEKQGITNTENRIRRERLKNAINRLITEQIRMESRLKGEKKSDQQVFQVPGSIFADKTLEEAADNLETEIRDKWKAVMDRFTTDSRERVVVDGRLPEDRATIDGRLAENRAVMDKRLEQERFAMIKRLVEGEEVMRARLTKEWEAMERKFTEERTAMDTRFTDERMAMDERHADEQAAIDKRLAEEERAAIKKTLAEELTVMARTLSEEKEIMNAELTEGVEVTHTRLSEVRAAIDRKLGEARVAMDGRRAKGEEVMNSRFTEARVEMDWRHVEERAAMDRRYAKERAAIDKGFIQTLDTENLKSKSINLKTSFRETRKRCEVKMKRMRDRLRGERAEVEARLGVVDVERPEFTNYSSSEFIAALTVSTHKYLGLIPAMNTGNEKVTAISRALARNTEVTVIDFSYCHLQDKEAKDIAAVLKEIKHVTSINMSNNEIRTEGALALADALKANNNILSMDIWANYVDSDNEGNIRNLLKRNRDVLKMHQNRSPTIFCEDVLVSDTARKGRPYLWFRYSSSKCIIVFFAHKELNGKSLTLRLNHRLLSSTGTLDIRLNHEAVDQIQGDYHPQDEFKVQELRIWGFIEESHNELSIAFKLPGGQGTYGDEDYLLSDVDLLPEGEEEWPGDPDPNNKSNEI